MQADLGEHEVHLSVPIHILCMLSSLLLQSDELVLMLADVGCERCFAHALVDVWLLAERSKLLEFQDNHSRAAQVPD